MNKVSTIFLIIFGLVFFTKAEEHVIKVGYPEGKNLYAPDTITAAMGDTVKFVWISGQHSVIESNAKGSCKALASSDAFFTGVFDAPKEWTLNIKDASGKKWFFCSVEGHCAAGMVGTIVIGKFAAPSEVSPKTTQNAPPETLYKTPPGPSPGIPPGPKSVPESSAKPAPVMVGVIIGSMLGGSLLTAGIFILYKWNKNKQGKRDTESLAITNNKSDDNGKNKDVVNNEIRLDNESNNEVIDNGIRLPDNEVYNHGQGAIRNVDSEIIQHLKNEMTQIIRQEIKNLK
ncbi:12978_t:CDS:2 [Funneliformis geosporum]|uniref:11983_t:CDS:1 n=1 Tax=Funneliformis geosporum TaxID=1117311 RepID=A0A9W4SCU5_9GLOM|nr:11983_t:CDS:2 [Funneliformis geosporum]CAI2164537.1 12978_t:CDS:2 [Funneliformis geosporum]